jgi:hypothetical protein
MNGHGSISPPPILRGPLCSSVCCSPPSSLKNHSKYQLNASSLAVPCLSFPFCALERLFLLYRVQ